MQSGSQKSRIQKKIVNIHCPKSSRCLELIFFMLSVFFFLYNTQAIADFKEKHPLCMNCGFQLAEDQNPVARHFGLQLIEDFVK